MRRKSTLRKKPAELCRGSGISLPDRLTKQWRAEARRRNMTLSRLTRIVMTEVFHNPRLSSNLEVLLFNHGTNWPRKFTQVAGQEHTGCVAETHLESR
jgi:hypothetical protein